MDVVEGVRLHSALNRVCSQQPLFWPTLILNLNSLLIVMLVGMVLEQYCHNALMITSYASRALTKAERKYCATRKEMLALVWAVGQFRP